MNNDRCDTEREDARGDESYKCCNWVWHRAKRDGDDRVPKDSQMTDDDPNEAYEVVPMKQEPHGPPADWWTVTKNGIPDRHFATSRKAEAERYATDPTYRAATRGKSKLHEKGR